MVQTTILIMSLALALILIVVGFYEYRNGGYLKLSGFVILFIISLVPLISPIKIRTLEQTNTTNTYIFDENETLLDTTNSDTTFIYTENSNVLNTVFGIILLLAGLYGIMRSRQDIMSDKEKLYD